MSGPDFSTPKATLQTAEQWFDQTVKAAFLKKVQAAIESGAIDSSNDLNFMLLRNVLVITADSFSKPNDPDFEKQLSNLREFI